MTAVFYTAPWCQTCRGVKPHVSGACHDAGIDLVTIDVGADPEEGILANVSQLPAILILRDGAEVDRIVGPISRYEMGKRLVEAKD